MASRNLITDVAGRPGRPCRRRASSAPASTVDRVRQPPWWRAWTCAAAGRARARPRCSIRRRRWRASTPSCCPAARPSGSTPPPACRPGCASRAAASPVREARVPIVPGAILFDLLNGGDKDWGRYPPYRELGYEAAKSAGADCRARQRRRRAWRHHRQPQGRHRLGLGRDARRARRSARIVAVNAAGSVTDRRRPAFLGGAVRAERGIRRARLAAVVSARRARAAAARARPAPSTTLAVVATDAKLTKAQAKRLAVMAQTGLARAIYPVHTPLDGDMVFAAATGRQAARRSGLRAERARHAGRQCAGARHRARRLRGDGAALPGALPSWKDKFGKLRMPPGKDRDRLRPSTGRWIRPPGELENRSARYGAGSQNGVSPVIISAIMRPVAGPSVSPQCAWPMASHRPARPGARPMTGRESGKHGRAPSQVFVVARARRAETARAPSASCGRTAPASACASRAANSTPVVRRMPCSIGVIR